ncbi:hypothetical protein FOXB_17351 [Fusarium oxysporum f. sp. conglutinans Fo5176]|uniref:Uncharacterized protein n=1 Tax=Fusarium oxysporum (strain Fo5176) TaxID=660025 RepID=F9GFB7_FUSOF|nr:hypothetical protein FOXB_17351 [Fusarium oxysporum f. sp. conglutinans Fo5176]
MFGGPVSVYPDTNPLFDHDLQTGTHSRADGYITDFDTSCFFAECQIPLQQGQYNLRNGYF